MEIVKSISTLCRIVVLSLVQGDLLYATAADTITRLAKGTAAQVLAMNAGATAPEWVSKSKAPDAVMEDQKAAGTSAQAYTPSAWTTRNLNTEAYDPDGLVSIASNQFTPTVNGWVEWLVEVQGSGKTRLRNITDSTTDSNGTTTSGNLTFGGGAVTAGKTYAIQYYQAGSGASLAGVNQGVEVYMRVMFWRT